MKRKNFIYVILIVTPLVISSLFLALQSSRQSLLTIMPSLSDEVFYYNQVKSMIKYGAPQGYYGYDGSHALLGTFGAHGWFLFLPYVLFGKIFGWHFNSIAILNNILLCAAIAFFVYMFKPSIKKTIMFIIAVSSPLVIYFVNSSMMEGENYFYAIILAIVMSYIVKNDDFNSAKKYFLIVFVVWAALSRVTWSIMLFPVVLIFFNNKKWNIVVKWMIAGGITIIGTAIGYIFFRIFGAPYFTGTYAGNSITNIVKNGLTYSNVRSILEAIWDGLGYTFGKKYDEMWQNVAKWYIIFAFLLVLFYWILNLKKKMSYIPIVILGGATMGILVFYRSGMEAVRNIYPFAVFSVIYILCSVKEDVFQWGVSAFCLLFLLETMIVQKQYGYEYRLWYSSENTEYYADIERNMSQIIINKGSNPWENTMAIVPESSPSSLYQCLAPAGVGINYYWTVPEEKESFKPEYCLLKQGDTPWAEKLKEYGYEEIMKYEDAILYKK